MPKQHVCNILSKDYTPVGFEVRFSVRKADTMTTSATPPCLAWAPFRNGFQAGLPDGLFSNQKSQFGYILEGLAMENLGLFYDHLVYFITIWSIL
jgi:hypothetical protein